jgi:hypothetical protein
MSFTLHIYYYYYYYYNYIGETQSGKGRLDIEE